MPSDLGIEIRTARAEKTLSLRGLARAIGKSPAFVNMLETGRSSLARTLFGSS
jgi:transcriptional regulator with XRE-family HTH domain